MNKGDIYWVDIPHRMPEGREITKRRPCILISATVVNDSKRSTILVVPLTSNNKTYPPFAIAIPSAGQGSVAVCDQIFAVDKARLGERMGRMSDDELEELEVNIRKILAL